MATATMISLSPSSLLLLLLLSLSPFLVLSDRTLETFKILPTSSFGPESTVFTLTGHGPYTPVNDGRVLKYHGPETGFVDFAYAAPNRTKEVCDGTTDVSLGRRCGRPLGIAFDYRTSELYISDAYHALCVVGPEGGPAKQLVTSAEGGELKWLDAVEVDQNTGIVYFTDVSTVYGYDQIDLHLSTGDATGRLISYNPETKEVKVLMSGLAGAGGVAVSQDSSFVLVSEFAGSRIQKYWLKGPKANTGELFMSIPGPANIKRTQRGDFWVSSSVVQEQDSAPLTVPQGVRIDGGGNVLEIITLGGIYTNTTINEVQEFGGSYFIGSIFVNFIGEAKI